MSAEDPKKNLKGLARSIDALFDEGGGAAADQGDIQASESSPAAGSDDLRTDVGPSGVEVEPTSGGSSEANPAVRGEDLVWEDVDKRPPPAVDPDPDALARAIDLFLASDPLEREGQGRALREQVVALREASVIEPIADAVESLALRAGDPPDEACIAMARSLVSAGAASRLVSELGASREEDRRAELMLVCQRVGPEMAAAVADALSETTDRFARRTFLECMVSMGQTGMAVVEDMVEDPRWFVVRNALAILGEVGGDRPVELVIGTLAHGDARVRREALLALAKVGGEDAGILVVGMLEDPDSDVRRAAAVASGELKVERALKPLLSLLESDEDPDVSVGVLQALGQLGDPGAVQAIEKRAVGSFFAKPPAEVRIAAYRALHGIGTPHAKKLLQSASEDKDPEVKEAVRSLLGLN
jgi:HEAT repeat protein